jgi:hypothetical protein
MIVGISSNKFKTDVNSNRPKASENSSKFDCLAHFIAA